jgi:transcription elongation factor Elf1
MGRAGAGSVAEVSGSQPFYCPYCGEQDFEPASEEAGTFVCGSCDRSWKVRLVAVNVTRGGS